MSAEIKYLDDFRPEPKVMESKVADLDNGYTRIANELLDAIMLAGLTKHQLLMVMAVWRKTYGFNKKMDWVGNEQLESMTKIDSTKCSTAKNQLVRMKIFIQEGRKIGMNKNISEWKTDIDRNSKGFTETVKNSFTKTVKTTLPKQSNTKDNNTKDKRQDPTIPPKGGNRGGSLREELISILEGKFDFDKADKLHDSVEQKLVELGYICEREFRVSDRGDGKAGRVDLLVSNGEGDSCGIEIDRLNARDKSIVKLKQLSDGFVLVREGIVSERYDFDGIPVVSAHPMSSSSEGISREEIIREAREALDFYNNITGSQCRDFKPFMTLLSPTQSRDRYLLSDLITVIEWVVSTWKRRNNSIAKPTNICRVNRFDGYLSDALKWKNRDGINPVDCPHEELIKIWNKYVPERAIDFHEWTSRRPAYKDLEAVWNGKTNKGQWREVKHMDTCFKLISQSSLFTGLQDKGWLTLDWILTPTRWSQTYEQAKREYTERKKGIV
ncbi:TPA: replication protein [Proteus mirabilis]|uniref:Phage replication protein O, N-terminal domain n=1 Tax=Proteus mirabilis TaxID=584 RepID=A0A2X2BFU2_PROMI|nr:phage replication protein O, N-terminal domain [Proteus mirabilis]